MVTISNNGFITLNRGDSFSVPLFINGGSELVPIRYSLSAHPETEIYFGVMEPGQPFENAIIISHFFELILCNFYLFRQPFFYPKNYSFTPPAVEPLIIYLDKHK